MGFYIDPKEERNNQLRSLGKRMSRDAASVEPLEPNWDHSYSLVEPVIITCAFSTQIPRDHRRDHCAVAVLELHAALVAMR
eukprot:6471715-Amphidinium_carterae.1